MTNDSFQAAGLKDISQVLVDDLYSRMPTVSSDYQRVLEVLHVTINVLSVCRTQQKVSNQEASKISAILETIVDAVSIRKSSELDIESLERTMTAIAYLQKAMNLWMLPITSTSGDNQSGYTTVSGQCAAMATSHIDVLYDTMDNIDDKFLETAKSLVTLLEISTRLTSMY